MGVKRIPIKAVERLCKQYDLQGAVIVAVNGDGVLFSASWAENQHKCLWLGAWLEGLVNKGCSIIPFVTHFGWGIGGRDPDASKISENAIEALRSSDVLTTLRGRK